MTHSSIHPSFQRFQPVRPSSKWTRSASLWQEVTADRKPGANGIHLLHSNDFSGWHHFRYRFVSKNGELKNKTTDETNLRESGQMT